MINRIEVSRDGYGLVWHTFNNPLDVVRYSDIVIGPNVTIGRILVFAATIWDDLVWVDTDAGQRAKIKFGPYVAYIYR